MTCRLIRRYLATRLSPALIPRSWWTCCLPDISGSHSDARRNASVVRFSIKWQVSRLLQEQFGIVKRFPRMGIKGVSGFCDGTKMHKCLLQMTFWQLLVSLSPCLCLIFRVYPPDPPSRWHRSAAHLLLSPRNDTENIPRGHNII